MVGLKLKNGYIHVENKRIEVEKWLDWGWKTIGLGLKNGWIRVEKWLYYGWKIVW